MVKGRNYALALNEVSGQGFKKMALLACALTCIVVLESSAFADQTVTGSWVRTTAGCETWVSSQPADTEVTWSGECIAGRASGHGILTMQGAFGPECYDVDMTNGKMKGPGVAEIPTFGRISGEWHDGSIDGQVVYDRPDGFHYEGAWLGVPEGTGTATWPDGRHYVGSWHVGNPYGQGFMTYPGGSTYEGSFLDGRRAGHGIVRFPDGNRIEGNWNDQGLVGRASTLSLGGDRYDGYVNGKERQGQGTFAWANGDRYDGEWHHNYPDGAGTLTRRDGTSYAGTWKHGCFRAGERHAALFVKEDTCQ